VKVVYRSTHPDVFAHWEATASADAQQAWRDRVNAVLADLGFPGRRFATKAETRVIGVEHPTNEDIPEGWRRDRDLPSAIVPNRRTAAGKKIGKRLDELNRPDPRNNLPGGMPGDAFNSHTLMFPGIAKHAGAVYVIWSDAIDDTNRVDIDSSVWERIRLSEYYAVLEAEEANAS
jgi:hypothetical protein